MADKEKWIEGDRAVEQFKKKVKSIVDSNKSIEARAKDMTDELQKAAAPWDLKGDDRVLSMMNMEAGVAFSEMIEKEIKNASKDRLDELRKLVEGVSWLARGFKSSLGVKISLNTVLEIFKNPDEC